MGALCYALAYNERRSAWLIAFNDPARGLTPDRPCYVNSDDILSLTAIDGTTGEILPTRYESGPGVIDITMHVWHTLPNLIASYLIEEERIARLMRKLEQDAIDRLPGNVRRKEDRMLRARNAKQGKR